MASDGYIDPAAASSTTLAYVLGLALQDVAVGQRVDVVVHGPVLSASGGTPGLPVYLSDTAGEYGEATGTVTSLIGIAESATVIFVRPQISTADFGS
jgi:hypothetical protein